MRTVIVLCMIAVAASVCKGQDTFSIVAVDSSTGIVGSAGASCIDSAIVICDIHPGVGAIHSQALWLPSNQNYARALMNQGRSPEQIIDSLIAHDVEGNPTVRQYGIVDLVGGGRSAGYTGINCPNYKNHILGPDYAIAGNILAGQRILDSMQARFLNTSGSLVDRLMAALQGAKVPGADTRCLSSGRSSISAFIRVAWPRDTTGSLYLDLDVENPPHDPIDSLQTLYDQWKAFPYLNKRSIAFGAHEVGQRSDSVTITVTNYNVSTLTILTISQPDSRFILSGVPALPVILAPFQTLSFSVSFLSQAASSAHDTIFVTSSDPLHPSGKIGLSGKGVVMRPALAGVLYAASSGTPEGYLHSINAATGDVSAIGSLGTSEIHGMAIRHSDRIIYGSYASPTSTALYRICSETGDAVHTRVIPVGNLRAIAFSPGDTLYGATTTGSLYRIDLTTGHADSVGTAPGLIYYGLSFRPRLNQLWASVRTPIDSIFTLNTTTGTATFVGVTGFNALTNSLAFDPRGNLFGLIDNGSGEDYLASIDTITASGSIIAGPLSVSHLQAIAMRTDSVATSVAEGHDGNIPRSYSLSQNYPDPFNPSTTIRYDLPMDSRVSLKLFNVVGQEIATLVNEEQKAGYKSAVWNASGVASGVYFYRLDAGSYTSVKKLLLLK